MSIIWPIGGGKGGSGKSFLTANLGVLLAKQGYRTLLLDADLGAANLHTMIGFPHQDRCLSDFINKKVATIEETVSEASISNLFLISGAKNNLDMSNLAYEQKMKVLRALSKMNYDYVLVDLGAGTSFNTIDFFMISQYGVFVTTPEPTSIENIYRLIRSVYARKIRHILKQYRFRTAAGEAENRNQDAMVNNPEILLNAIKELEPDQGKLVEEALRNLRFKLILNQLRQVDNPNTGSLICRVIAKHLGLSLEYVGAVGFDDRVHDAVCRRTPFVDQYPNTQTTIDLKNCSRVLLKTPAVEIAIPPNGNGSSEARMVEAYA